jgi:hypothetical protein
MAEPRDDWVTLVCPPGAELAPISHGDRCYEPYREDIHKHSRWLVEVPKHVAIHLSGSAALRRSKRNDEISVCAVFEAGLSCRRPWQARPR